MENLRSPRIVAVWLLMAFIGAGVADLGEVYMNERCGETIQAGRSGGNMASQDDLFYEDFNCTVTITADLGRRMLLTFTTVDIDGTPNGVSGCDGDYLEVFDGTTTMVSPLKVICTTSPGNIVSTLPSITLRFRTDSTLRDSFATGHGGFFLSYTSFTTSDFLSCASDEFECDNHRCIDTSLEDNLYDNCGDYSDEHFLENLGDTINNAIGLGIGIIVAIIVGCIVGLVLLCLCVGCLCYHACCKKPRPQTQFTYQVLANAPQSQQPTIAMQPTSQSGLPAYPPAQPVHPAGQPAYPAGQPTYPAGQPAYPPGQPGGLYPAEEKV